MRKRADPGKDDKGDADANAPRVKRFGPARLATLAAAKAQGLAARHGLQSLSVATRWRDLAGPQLAAHVQPIGITFPKGSKTGGTLTLRADGGAALLVQHQSREILARVNALLGEGAIRQLKLSQGTLPKRPLPPKPPPPRLSPVEAAEVRRSVEGVQDTDLRIALEQLMRHAVAERRR